MVDTTVPLAAATPEDDDTIRQLSEALMDFLEDADIRRRALPPANFWSIVHYGENSYENRYNRVVRWLIDPTANHGLGPDVINELISEAAARAEVEVPPLIGSGRVRTAVESRAKQVAAAPAQGVAGRIDVTLLDKDNHVVVAIESKLSSTAHGDQLARYANYLEAEHADLTRVMLFLTENDEKPSDPRWWPITYKSLALILGRLNGRDSQDSAAQRVIGDFCDDIDRRASDPLGTSVTELYFHDYDDHTKPTNPRFAHLLVTLAAHFAASDKAMDASTAGRLRAYLQTLPGGVDSSNAAAYTEQLTAAFEASGKYSSNDLIRTLTYVIDHAPIVGGQNHRRNEGVSEFFAEYVRYLTGVAEPQLEPHDVLPEHTGRGYLRTVRMNNGRKGVTFNSGTPGQRPFRIAGNDVERFPVWIAHTHRTEACRFAGRLFQKQPLSDWTAETLHLAVLNALARAGETCRCGELLSS